MRKQYHVIHPTYANRNGTLLMDPVAHTLLGATLAQAGLKKLSRYASATLIIGANLPDIDVAAQFWGEDTALHVRRGWSHGILAMLVLPLILAGLVWAWHRWRGRHHHDAPPLRPWMIIALTFIGVWSHPLLDWLNTYGVRLLMPFSGTWFYGDTLFIIDPWFWLLTAAGVVLACHHRGGLIGWALLAILTTALILSSSLVSPIVKVLWLCGIVTIILLRWRGIYTATWTARLSLATLTLYIGCAYGLARLAEAQYHSGSDKPLLVQVNPTPGDPFSHRVVTVHETYYRIFSADGEHIDVLKQPPNPIVQAAMDKDAIKGFVNWMRFPFWEITEKEDHWIVEIRDLRYLDPDEKPRGIGYTKVEVSKASIQESR